MLLSKEIVFALYCRYVEGETIGSLAKKHGVSPATLVKYWKGYGWTTKGRGFHGNKERHVAAGTIGGNANKVSHLRNISSSGGLATLDKYGQEYMRKIGTKGGSKSRKGKTNG